MKRWTRHEDRAIKHLYPYGKRVELRQKCPGRTWEAIRSRAQVLGVRQFVPWNPQEDVIIRLYYANYSRMKLQTLLPGRSWAAIRARANRLEVERLVGQFDVPIDELKETANG